MREQRALQRALYRVECPAPHTLGEYVLALLPGDQQRDVAAHVFDCPRCADELQTLRAFLSVEPEVQPGTVERLRRIVATLVAPPLRGAVAYAGLRGNDAAASRTYEAEGITVTVGVEPEADRTRVTLTGLVAAPDDTDLAQGEARLVDPNGGARTAPIDDLGNFVLESVAAGKHTLELRLPGRIVAIEELQVGGE
jgi:hypothetical protein